MYILLLSCYTSAYVEKMLGHFEGPFSFPELRWYEEILLDLLERKNSEKLDPISILGDKLK